MYVKLANELINLLLPAKTWLQLKDINNYSQNIVCLGNGIGSINLKVFLALCVH